MAATTQQRSAKRNDQRKAKGVEELRLLTMAGTRAALADLMAWHGIEQQGEAMTLLIHNMHAQLERWLHKPSGRRGCVIFEVAGTCELQGIDGRSFYAKREDLNNTETWERLP